LVGWDLREGVNDNGTYYKYVCITTNQPDTTSNTNPYPNHNRTPKQHKIVSIQLNIATYPENFILGNVVAPLLLLSVVIVPSLGSYRHFQHNQALKISPVSSLTSHPIYIYILGHAS